MAKKIRKRGRGAPTLGSNKPDGVSEVVRFRSPNKDAYEAAAKKAGHGNVSRWIRETLDVAAKS